MTDTAPAPLSVVDAIARVEAVLAQLKAVEAQPFAAVLPDGRPDHVAAGELIESAWGNAVVDTLARLVWDYAIGSITVDVPVAGAGGTVVDWDWTAYGTGLVSSGDARGRVRFVETGVYLLHGVVTFSGPSPWVQAFAEHLRGGASITLRNALASSAGGFGSVPLAFAYGAVAGDELEVRVSANSAVTVAAASSMLTVTRLSRS